jgi:uncharacterized protein with PIN domain
MTGTQQAYTRPELHQAAIDSLLTVLRETRAASERAADLESDVKTYRMLAAAALESVAALTKRNRHLADRIDELNAFVRKLMDAPCSICRRGPKGRVA